MKKKILSVVLAVVVACAMLFAFTACAQHKCKDVCPECKLCLTKCDNAACSKKCQGHDEKGNNEGDKKDDENQQGDDEGEGFTVTFVCDANVTVYVYKTQDMSASGTKTTTAYSRDGETGALLNDGNGQVNFKLVFADGYKLKDIDITEGYNNLKGSADTGVENGFRITKITADLTVTVTSQSKNVQEDLTQGYKITFVCDEHVEVVVYKTQDMTGDGEKTDTAYSRESGTGTLTKDGEGQVNFKLVFAKGYELNGVTVAPKDSYKNLKDLSQEEKEEDQVENGFRITKISGELTVTVTSKQEGAAEDFTQGFKVEFQCSEHVKIIVYRTQNTSGDGEETTTAYSRDGKSGALTKDEGQVNFKIVCDEGYEVLAENIVINGLYNKLNNQGENVWRITKISSVLTISVTATPVSSGN